VDQEHEQVVRGGLLPRSDLPPLQGAHDRTKKLPENETRRGPNSGEKTPNTIVASPSDGQRILDSARACASEKEGDI